MDQWCITKYRHNRSGVITLALQEMPLQNHLGYFNHIIRLSQLHQCDQGMLSKCLFFQVHLGAFSFITLASFFFQKTYLATFLAFLPQACNQFTVKKGNLRLFWLNSVTSIFFYLSTFIVKHSGVPLPALDSTQIYDWIWLSKILVNVMEEYFGSEIVQSCEKGNETKVTKMGSNYIRFLTVQEIYRGRCARSTNLTRNADL